jgi:membrane-associated phospholipid phosphatase
VEKERKLVIAGLVSLILFAVNTLLVFYGTTQSFDARLALWINNADLGAAGTQLMILASQYGRDLFWPLVVGIMILFGKRETRLLGVELLVLLGVGIVTGDVLKAVWFRYRPFDSASGVTGIVTRIVALDLDSSYPSGHALIVSIGAVFSLLKFSRKGIAALLALEAVLVCYSRIYLGVHYPLDVVGSVFAASTIVFLGTFLLERYADDLGRMVDYVLGKLLGNGWLKI